MNYTKYEIGPYNIHIIETNKFKTINIKTVFKRKIVKEEVTIRNFLSDILLSSCKKYQSEREIAIASENLYDPYYRTNVTISGNYSLLTFDISFLNKKYTEPDIFDKSVEFMSEILFNPNIIENKFDKKAFQIVKIALKKQIESITDNPKRYSLIRLLEEMDKNSVMAIRKDGSLDDLEKITEENLYKYYLDVIKKDKVDIFIIGDVDKCDVKDTIKKYFKLNTIKKNNKDNHFIEHKKYHLRNKEFKENKDVNQSNLQIGCKLINLSEFEMKYVSTIYSIILGGGTDSLLFKNVREKNSLCYSVSSNIYRVYNLMIISAGIDFENYKKTISLIKKEMNNMKNGKFDESNIEAAKAIFINTCEELMDSPIDIINSYIAKNYLDIDLLDERIKNIVNVTKDDIINFSKKVKLDTIFCLVGGSDNE